MGRLEDERLSIEWRLRDAAQLRLARLQSSDAATLGQLFASLALIAAETLHVERVSIWLFERDVGRFRCVHVHDPRVAPGQPLASLATADVASYEHALHERRAVPVDDVRNYRFSRALIEPYFEPQGITATLDVPIYRGGAVVGVVCMEHRGGPRAWTNEQVSFGIHVAEVTATIMATDELRQAERELREEDERVHEVHTEAALSQLAAGVAHDFNNLLMVIAANAELLKPHATSPAASELVDDILTVAGRAKDLIRQLQLYCRDGVTAPACCAVDEVLESYRRTLDSMAGSDGEVTVHLTAPTVEVPLAATQLEQVISNLVVNARDACACGAHIDVVTRIDHEPRGGKAGPAMLSLEVSDDGAGMDPATAKRVFEPYFSTKAGDQRGLGLATVHGIVTGAGGRVSLESVAGAGTRVTVRLPICGAHVAVDEGNDATPPSLRLAT